MKVKEIIKEVKEEILSLLQDDIENEVFAMGTFYPIAEISKEVLLNFDRKRFN